MIERCRQRVPDATLGCPRWMISTRRGATRRSSAPAASASGSTREQDIHARKQLHESTLVLDNEEKPFRWHVRIGASPLGRGRQARWRSVSFRCLLPQSASRRNRRDANAPAARRTPISSEPMLQPRWPCGIGGFTAPRRRVASMAPNRRPRQSPDARPGECAGMSPEILGESMTVARSRRDDR